MADPQLAPETHGALDWGRTPRFYVPPLSELARCLLRGLATTGLETQQGRCRALRREGWRSADVGDTGDASCGVRSPSSGTCLSLGEEPVLRVCASSEGKSSQRVAIGLIIVCSLATFTSVKSLASLEVVDILVLFLICFFGQIQEFITLFSCPRPLF